MPTGPEKFFIALRSNGGLKLLALGLAFVCWYTLREATSFERMVRRIPLRIETASGIAVLDQSVSEVNVLCRGSEGDLRFLDAERITVEVDMRGHATSGTRTVRLTPDRARAPAGVRVLQIDPPQVILSLDTESDKVVPVKADIVGTPPEDFEVDRVVCTPATVTLHGPRARIEQVVAVRTEPLDLEGRIRSFQLERDILKPGENWSARVEPSRVRVEVSIVEISARKVLDEVPVSALVRAGGSGAVNFQPSFVKIVLQGRQAMMQELDRNRIHAFVDCSQLKSGQPLELPVRVPVAAGVDVVSIEPKLVRATLEAR